MKVSLLHMKVRSTIEKNLEAAKTGINKAALEKPVLIALPEFFSVPNCMENFNDAQKISEETYRTTIEFLKEISAEIPDIYLLGGTVLEREGDQCYNTSSLWKKGKRLAKYNKINPIQGETKAGVAKGTQPLVIQTEIGAIGLLVCADVFDPVLVKQTAELGAEIFSLPVAAMGTHPSVKGHPLTEKVASDYGLFILKVGNVSSNAIGGRSAIIAPWGILREATDEPEDAILTADLDMQRLRKYRKRLSKA